MNRQRPENGELPAAGCRTHRRSRWGDRPVGVGADDRQGDLPPSALPALGTRGAFASPGRPLGGRFLAGHTRWIEVPATWHSSKTHRQAQPPPFGCARRWPTASQRGSPRRLPCLPPWTHSYHPVPPRADPPRPLSPQSLSSAHRDWVCLQTRRCGISIYRTLPRHPQSPLLLLGVRVMLRRLAALSGGLLLLCTAPLYAQNAVSQEMYGAGVHAYFSGNYQRAHDVAHLGDRLRGQ